ncbi:MAG: S-layer homology domain-containing protein [Oscillospiraceae bacterium]|jgi:5'-nucleotidase/UDP-sugar diphosphatase
MKHRTKQWMLLLFATAVLVCMGNVFAHGAEEEPKGTYDGQIIILHTNDIHGAVATKDADGKAVLGIASAAQMKRDLEEMGAYVLLLDAGDFASGTSLVRPSEGESAVEFMNAAGYDAVCIGEGEFDYGYPQMAYLASCAEFPFLAANAEESGETSLQDRTIFTAPDGTKIGVFGLTTPELKTELHPARTEGVTILADAALIFCAQEQVAQLQEAGCTLIVCVAHLGTDETNAGSRSIDVAQQVDGIDLLIDGHSHETIAEGDANHQINGTMVVSAGSELEAIGMVVYDGETLSSELFTIRDYSGIDSTVDELVLAVEEKNAADSKEVFATTTVALQTSSRKETNFGDLVSDALFWKADQIDGAIDVAILDSAGLSAALPEGEIRREEIRAVLPTDDTLQIIEITGAELLEILEASTQYTPEEFDGFPQEKGIQYVVDTNVAFEADGTYPDSAVSKPATPGSRVTILSVDERKFDPAATYTVATSSRLAKGLDAYTALSNAAAGYDLHIPLDEAVMDYITEALSRTVGTDYKETKGRATIILIPFTDVSIEDWYFDAVQYVYEHDIMQGMENNQFCPMVSMSRAMLVTMLYRLAGCPAVDASASTYFTDVADTIWYADAVVWAVEQGITNGMEAGIFDPSRTLDRQQMATFFHRYAKLCGDVSGTENYELNYYDTAEIDDWALDAVSYCTATGLMQGVENNKFAPHTAANRAMGATVFMRFMQLAQE